MTESEVRKLLRQMKEQDSQTAFRDFYDMTYDRLFRIAYYYVKQEEWSQEIVLDVFLRLWKQRDTLLDVRNIEDYCFILVKNASLNYLEKESKYTTVHSSCLPEPQEQSCSPEETLITEELFALYVKALDRLPERCRQPVEGNDCKQSDRKLLRRKWNTFIFNLYLLNTNREILVTSGLYQQINRIEYEVYRYRIGNDTKQAHRFHTLATWALFSSSQLSAVGKATKTTYPVFIPDAYAYIGSSGSCYSALSFGRNSIFIYATDFTPNSIHNGRNT